ncbi:MAG TPA: hypothetical protein VFV35_02490 [Acidimicrobiales bacterium]|nr:hypothetical protein [Acidimicrobiales bacterium]
MPAEIAALLIGDPPDVWSALGFVVDDGAVHVSGVRHILGGASPGISEWSMRGVDASDIDGLALTLPVAPAQPTPDHPNGVLGLDHLVVGSPDVTRTIGALEAAGIGLRRTRDVPAGRSPVAMLQAFFRLGEVILELVGPAEGAGDGAPSLFGLAWTVRDLDETASFLGKRLRPAKDAVQPGRRIATLDRALGGSTVSMAFMSADA